MASVVFHLIISWACWHRISYNSKLWSTKLTGLVKSLHVEIAKSFFYTWGRFIESAPANFFLRLSGLSCFKCFDRKQDWRPPIFFFAPNFFLHSWQAEIIFFDPLYRWWLSQQKRQLTVDAEKTDRAAAYRRLGQLNCPEIVSINSSSGFCHDVD